MELSLLWWVGGMEGLGGGLVAESGWPSLAIQGNGVTMMATAQR